MEDTHSTCAILLVTDSTFVKELASVLVEGSTKELVVVSKWELRKLELESLHRYAHIFIDSNHPRDLHTYKKLFGMFPQICVLGSYDPPIEWATGPDNFNYKLKGHSMRKLFQSL